jgi:putative hydrolase of the HAD superfamily
MPIKAITFDFWSTLYRSATVDYTKRLLELQRNVEQRSGTEFDPDQFRDAVKLARQTWTQTWVNEYRTIPADEWLGVVLAQLEVSLDAEHLRQVRIGLEESVYQDLPNLVPEARTVLADLSTTHRLAIISDTGITPGRVLRRLLEQDEVIDYFSQLTFSDEIGYSKPHPQAFLTTLNRLGVVPQEAVHIGDLLRTDVAGAQGVGMRAVQYTGINQDGSLSIGDAPVSHIEPDAVIQSHTELRPLLRQWNNRQPA